MRLIVEPVWSWTWIVIATTAMFSLVLLTYPSRVRPFSPFWRRLLVGLRLLAVLALLFAMLRPSVQFTETDKQQSSLAVLLDRSRSMNTTDGPRGFTRRESMLKMLQDHQEPWEQLRREVDVKLFDFANDLKPVVVPEPQADGQITAIGKVLDEVRERERTDRLLGVLLLSDGAQRAGGEDDVDPLLAARRLAEEKGVPVHAVVFGTSELSTSGLDLAIDDLVLDQSVTFERKIVPVRVQVRLQGAAGKKVRIQLLMEDRTGKSLGQSGPLMPIPLFGEARPFLEMQTGENSLTQNVELSFVAERAGEYKIAAEVVPAEGEIKLNNNRLETLITVRKGGLRVAYFDTLRTEQKFLRGLNETAKVQLDAQFVIRGRQGSRALMDPKLFEKGAYDVYLIGDIPAETFQSGGQDLLVQLAQRVREGAGLAMLGGHHNFGAGGYASSPLRDLLPVRMSATERLGPDETSDRQHLNHPLRMLPTRDGITHYLMRLSASENDQLWRQLPEMSGANKLTPRSGVFEILAESAQQEPLLIAGDTGGGRVLALGVDETWRWHLHGFAAEHQRFWQQVMLWLARKEFESDQPVWARVEPRNFPPLSRVPIEFGAQDANGNPIPDAHFDVEMIRPNGEIAKLVPQRMNEGGVSEFSQTKDPGDYWVRVSATKGGQSLGMSAMTRFVVDARDIELDNPAADPGLMSELAALTGGSVVTPEDFGPFLKTLLTEGIPSELKRFRRVNLWDGWPFLLVFSALMSMEWAFRKAKGLV